MIMTRSALESIAESFRTAIEMARDNGEFTPKPFRQERMNQFPTDCCDDTADLFTHYLFQVYGVDSIRVDATYYDDNVGFTCGHSWQIVEGWVVDLTGDQFENDTAIKIKGKKVYVDLMGSFHRQFKIVRREPSCGIDCLGDGCRDRMYRLYNSIIKYM